MESDPNRGCKRMIHDALLITKIEYPTIFKAFELISNDCGRQAGHTNYVIPLTWKNVISEIEKNLKNLFNDAETDFETLCIGEESERKAIVKEYRIILVDKLLQEFFEEFT